MWQLILLILMTLNAHAKPAAAGDAAVGAAAGGVAGAGPAEGKAAEAKERAGKQREVKEQKSKRALELEALAREIGEEGLLPSEMRSGGGLPRELAGLIAGYEGRTTDVEDVLHHTEVMMNALQELYDLVRVKMPTREQLSLLSYGSGKEFSAGAHTLVEPILDALLGKIATDEWTAKWNHLMKTSKDMVTAMLTNHQPEFQSFKACNRAGVMWPNAVEARRLWEASGFQLRPMLIMRWHMICPGCAAEVGYILPWMRPQYYHKPGCKSLAAVAADPRFKIAAYGEDIPEDQEHAGAIPWTFYIGMYLTKLMFRVLQTITKQNQ